MEKYFIDILIATFFNLIIVGALLSMLYGVWLLILPLSAIKLNQKINNRFSMRKATRRLEIPVSIEHWFYKHASISGSLIMFGAAYLFYLLFWDLNFAELANTLPGLSFLVWQWLLQSFQIFFAIISVVVFLMGFLILIRPSLLKPLEEKANKWISTRQNLHFMSSEVGQADLLLSRYPRQVAAIILLTSAIVLINIEKFNV